MTVEIFRQDEIWARAHAVHAGYSELLGRASWFAFVVRVRGAWVRGWGKKLSERRTSPPRGPVVNRSARALSLLRTGLP